MSEQVQSIVEAVRGLDASSSRKQLVDSIRGKYRHVPTSSESFLNRKQDDTALESRP